MVGKFRRIEGENDQKISVWPENSGGWKQKRLEIFRYGRKIPADGSGNIPVWSENSLRERENVFRCMETLVCGLRHIGRNFPSAFLSV